jgi:hypothetical protein
MMDEETGGLRKLHNEKPHSLYFSPNIKMIKSKRPRNTQNILVAKPEGKRSLRRCDNNIMLNIILASPE